MTTKTSLRVVESGNWSGSTSYYSRVPRLKTVVYQRLRRVKFYVMLIYRK